MENKTEVKNMQIASLTIPASTRDSLTYLFRRHPFTIYSPKVNLTQDELYKIYKESNYLSQNLEKYMISNIEYKITFEGEDNDKTIKFYQKDNLVECQYDFLNKPYIIKFENINEFNQKSIYIFQKEGYTILNRYIEDNKNIYEISNEENNKILLIKKKTLKISEEILKASEEKNNKLNELEEFKEKTLKINLKYLSSNFDTIFSKYQRDKDFIFKLNKERIEFFNKINDFINSEKLFYYITGSDGIGKTLSLLYYSSLHINQFLYFNVKSYYNEENDDDKFRNLFYNDIQKLILFNYPKKNIDRINYEYRTYIESLEEEYLKYSNLKNIRKFFKYLLSFLKICPLDNFIIILDQYKGDLSDPDYIGLNSIVDFILNNKKICKIKLIIASSVDNTSNKYILLRNLSKTYLNLNINDLSKILLNESLDNINIYNNENITSKKKEITENDDKLDNKNDCLFCENVFKKEKEKRKQELLEKSNNNIYISSESKCLIDKYYKYTTKDYYFALTDGKEIFQNILSKKELVMAEMFNFSLKYINKYLDLKNVTEKNSDDDSTYEKRVIELFYKQISEKMKLKITNFYETLFKANNKDNQYSNYIHMEFQSLCKLRNYIFYEKKFIMNDLAQQLILFPMKYLHIVINDYDKSFFPQNTMGLNYSFKLEYNNDFTRILINRIIKELYKNITNVSINSFRGSAEGSFLEIKIDELFRSNSSLVFDLSDLECRYLFSLVSKTDNSENTIKKHREEEVKLLFFGQDNYSIILIDDIDTDKIKKLNNNHYILNKNYYYFSQISLTGKAFDMCIIVKEKDNQYKLYLFQVSKNKTDELLKKFFYLLQADRVAQNLENLYNINITGRHLIFILPKTNYDSKFQENLKNLDFCYIFFDIYTNEFYNSEFEKINNFDFPGSFLNIEMMTDYTKINDNYIIWKNSMKSYINKKRNNTKSFYDIYIEKFYNTNSNRLIKLDLKPINDLILETIIFDKNAILKFIGNCDINNREKVRNIHRMVFIFKNEDKIYIDYQKIIYLLIKTKSDYQLKKIEDETEDIEHKEIELEEMILKRKPSNQKRYTMIQLTDLFNKKNKYENKCFCYLVVTETLLSQFYNWWC